MPRLFRRRKQRLASQQGDRYAITTAHARSLAELNSHPTLYTQRLVEQLSFVPTGGQRWVRTLQVKVPDSDEAHGPPSWWIVPLGQFQLQRFADIFVTHSSGARVDLLTRQQHGNALTKATLAKHLYTIPSESRERLEECNDAKPDYRRLRAELYQYFTAITDAERKFFLDSAVTHYVSLLKRTDLSAKEVERWKAGFLTDFKDTSETTKYLCWVMAEAGEVVNLQASYTVTDPEHKLKRKQLKRKSFRRGIKSLTTALIARRSAVRRKVLSDWYRQYGLAPFNYEFKIPTHRHTGSYYFTLEAPSKSYVTYLDWETSNSIDNKEVDCAHPSAHVHNEEVPEKEGAPEAENGGIMRAYLRCIPHHHKQILGTAILNIALVWLLTTEKFAANIGSPLAGVLVAAPSVLIAYLVRQQRHYYAHVMRRQRAILWGYLGISLIFLITVAFSASGESLKPTAVIVPAAWILAISSATIFGWYLPLGYGFDRVVAFLMEWKWDMVEKRDMIDPSAQRTWLKQLVNCIRQLWWRKANYRAIEEKWQCYQEAVAQYCRWTLRLTVVAIATIAIGMGLFWELPPKGEESSVSPIWAGRADKELLSRRQPPQTSSYPTPQPVPR